MMSSTNSDSSGCGDRAQVRGNSVIGIFLSLMVAAIVGVQVVIPIITGSIANLGNNTSATTITVLQLAPLFVALMLLVAVASPLMRRI